MESVTHLLLENPTKLYVALGLAEVVVLCVWFWRHSRPWGWAGLALPAAAVGVGLLAHFVQTDREQIDAAVGQAIAHLEAGRIDAATECLDERIALSGSADRTVRKYLFVPLVKLALSADPIAKILATTPATEVDADTAVTRLSATIICESGAGVKGSAWRLDWARRQGGWRITRIEIIEPAEMKREFSSRLTP